MIADIIGYTGEIIWDTSKPNGTPKKVLNVDKIKALGWDPKISLNEGIFKTYEFYKQNGKNT
jgi:GDP-L-fucose synthase